MNNVQKLMLGNVRLNTMRDEVKAVVGTVTSMIKENTPLETWNMPGGIYWSIERERITQISCFLIMPNRRLYHSSTHELKLEDVELVHGALEAFLDKALQKFPEVREQMAVIFHAAQT